MLKNDKITLRRAINCYKPTRLEACDGLERYMDSQRFKKKFGFHFEEIWNLDTEFAYFILVRLVHYRNVAMGIPCGFLSGRDQYGVPKEQRGDLERWKTVLDKMIRGFYLYLTKSFPTKKEEKIINKGMKLFAEHWRELWD